MTTHARDLFLDTLTVEQEDRVLTVRFCEPPHNFMTARMQKDLDTLAAAVDADTSVGAVVLTGGVPKRYITHFDIAEILAAASRVLGAVPGGEQALEGTPIGQSFSVARFNQVVLRIMRSPAADRPDLHCKFGDRRIRAGLAAAACPICHPLTRRADGTWELSS